MATPSSLSTAAGALGAAVPAPPSAILTESLKLALSEIPAITRAVSTLASQLEHTSTVMGPSQRAELRSSLFQATSPEKMVELVQNIDKECNLTAETWEAVAENLIESRSEASTVLKAWVKGPNSQRVLGMLPSTGFETSV